LNLIIDKLNELNQINKFYSILFSAYYCEEKQKNLNYLIFENLKKFKTKKLNQNNSL
jgi:hypothetical protein